MIQQRRWRGLGAVILLGGWLGLAGFGGAAASSADGPQEAPSAKELAAEKSVAAFRQVARVLRHPRCINCHPSGDRPHVGDDRRVHAMNVQRGPKGHGVPAMNCSTCHRSANQDLAKVPGAPHWHLAPRSMGWEGLDDHQLAESLKDRAKNGNRSLDDLLKHVRDDPLVGWAWKPGVGRAAPPVSHADFVVAFKAWMAGGAVSPPPGTTTY